MTGRGSTKGRIVGADCHQTNLNIVGCSPKHSTTSNDCSVLKVTNVSPRRRRSLRLKAINAVYKAEDALSSNLQQSGGDNNLCFNQIEVEKMSATDDPTINVTLKDLQKRCKSKKRKALNSIDSSTTSDLNDALVKPKEEEPDLKEPLICLKLNKSHKSSSGRKQKKHSQFSDSILPVEETNAQEPYLSISRRKSSSPVAADKSSIVKEVPAEDECNSIPEIVDENLKVTSDIDPLHVGGPDFVSTVKSETLETCNTFSSSSIFLDNCNALGGSTNQVSQKFCEEESADGESYCSTSKFIHPCGTSQTERVSCYSSPSSLSQMRASLEGDISKSVNEVKSEVIEIDPLVDNDAACLSASSDLNFIWKFNDPSNSSGELDERIDGRQLEHGDATFFTIEPLERFTNGVLEMDNYTNLPESSEEPLDCCVKEVSSEFMEADNYTNLPENGKEDCGEKIELDSSERFWHEISPSCSKSETQTLYTDNSQLVSTTADLSSDDCGRAGNYNIILEELLCDDTMNQLDSSSRTDSQERKFENSWEFRTRKESETQGEEISFPDAPICCCENDVTTENSLLSRDLYYLCHASGSSKEVGSFDSLIPKALSGDVQKNSNENHVVSHIEKISLLGKYDHCVSENSLFSSSCDLHAANVSSPETESLYCSAMDKMSNHCTEKAASSAEMDTGELINSHTEKGNSVGTCNPCNPHGSNTSFSYAYHSHAAIEIPPETEISYCFTADQMLDSFAEKAANSAEVIAKELVEALGWHSPQVSPPRSGAVNGFLNVEGSLFKASKRIQSSAKNKLFTSVDMPICLASETSNLIEGEECNMGSELKCNGGAKVEHPPKKLLSNRKDLSPTSQEKLWRALNGNEFDEEIKNSNHEEAEVMLSPKRMTKRLKSIKNGSFQPLSKGILKSPDTSDTNCSSSKNSLIHTQSQKAVTFTQRQMRDIENIATKLLKGLAYMKNIVMESVGSEACPSASSSFTPEEIRMAIEDASNLEATTKKWLSMMSKDCNRFCKIMNSTENKGAVPAAVKKQPKKITFADEAGGLLCHVKVFEQLPSSIVVPRNDS